MDFMEASQFHFSSSQKLCLLNQVLIYIVAPVINLVYKNLDCSEENNICSAAFGVNVEIQFQFTSNPAGTISLSFPSTSNSRVIDSTMIVITNINPLNAGEYRAVVTNAVKGITRANSVSVELTVGMALIEGIIICRFMIVLNMEVRLKYTYYAVKNYYDWSILWQNINYKQGSVKVCIVSICT